MLALLAALAFVGCHPEDPVIVSISPERGVPGEIILIEGAYFGAERGASFVTIAGTQPTAAAYLDWSDAMILLRAPDFGDAGLVFVHVEGRRSNGAFFANAAAIPRTVPGERSGIGPAIASISPPEAAVGSVVTITGSGFGNSRGSGAVFFTRESFSPTGARALVQVTDAEFGYELWTDREIRARVPDGAASGHLEVRTARGSSGPARFDVSAGPGTKTFGDRREHVITYSVTINTRDASEPNALHLWVPSPAASAEQRDIQMLSGSPAPSIMDYMGTSFHRLENLEAHSGANVNISWAVGVYEVRTEVRPEEIRRVASPIRDANTRACPRVPSDDPVVRGLAASIFGTQANPYLRARAIYEWMLRSLEWVPRARSDGVLYAVENLRADPFLGALLFVALLRAADVPSRPVAGVLVNPDRRALNHYWAEFWIDGLGWIPADPAMGASILAGGSPLPVEFLPQEARGYAEERADAAAFYFGNMDSRRIAFSRGVTDIAQLDPRGRTITHVRSYALQTLWEEAVGDIDYSSVWGSIIIYGR